AQEPQRRRLGRVAARSAHSRLSGEGQMNLPLRIQLSRAKGWRKPANTIVISRPGRYGNPFRLIDDHGAARIIGSDGMAYAADEDLRGNIAEQRVVELFRAWRLKPARFPTLPHPPPLEALRGHNLACWCRLCPIHRQGRPLGVACRDCRPCHSDVTLELANLEGERKRPLMTL